MKTNIFHRLQSVILFSFIAVASAWAQTFSVDGIQYTINDETPTEVSVTGHSLSGGDGTLDIVIPSTVENEGTTYAVTEIGYEAFCGLKATRSLHIPGSVQVIRGRAFYDQYYLSDLQLEEGNLTKIEDGAFDYNFSLKTVCFPSTLASIGSYSFRQMGNWRGEEVTITLPANLTSIGDGAFTEISYGTSIYCLCSTPPTIGGLPFNNTSEHATLYVRNDAVEAYSSIEPWSTFSGGVQGFDSGQCLAPDFFLTSSQKLRISCKSPVDAAIYYTIDGSEPSVDNGTLYTEPIMPERNCTVKAIAVKDGMVNSSANSYVIDFLRVDLPTVSMDSEFKVTMTTTVPNGKIYYYIRDDQPWGSWDGIAVNLSVSDFLSLDFKEYTEPFSIDHVCNIYAIVQKEDWKNYSGWGTEDVVRWYSTPAEYYLGQPSFNWDSSNKKFYMGYDDDAEADIYYTLDGNCPVPEETENCFKYDRSAEGTGIDIDRNCVVKAITAKVGKLNSIVNSYTITDVNSTFKLAGSELYFRYIDNNMANEVEVTAGGNYTGQIDIPATFEHLNKTFTVVRIGDNAFYNCDGITGVTIPESVSEIGAYAFYNCDGLTRIDIPGSVTKVCHNAFQECYNLENVTFGEGVRELEYQVFYNCDRLQKSSLPSTLTAIGDECFYSCDWLTNINVPAGVSTLGPRVFAYCYRLNSLQLNEGITSLGDECLRETALQQFVIPEGVTYIGSYCFYGCGSLVTVQLPSTLTTLRDRAFHNCPKLASIAIPEGITTLEYSLFDDDVSLASVSLPSTLTTIAGRAFNTCTALTSITIPAGVTRIDENALTECSSLQNIYVLPEVPPVANNEAFSDAYSRTTLVVPSEDAMTAYKGANYWASFDNIVVTATQRAQQPTFMLTDYKLTITSLTPDAKIYYSRNDEEIVIDDDHLYTSPIIFTRNETIRAIAVADGFDNSVESTFFRNDMKVPNPTFDLNRSTLKLGLTVETPQVDGFPETRIYYKYRRGYWDGDGEWQLYNDSVKMDRPGYVRCYVERDGWINSDEQDFNLSDNYYTATPSISALDNTTKTITISCDHGDATIYYTLNGSDPVSGETDVCHLYNGQNVTLDRNCEVRAMAVREGYFNSDVASRSFSGLTSTFFVEPFNYRLIDNSTTNVVEVTTTTSDITYEGDMTVPETIEYAGNTYTVTGIGYRAFYDKDNLTSISLPSTITYIASQAFMNSDALTSVTLPDAVKTIDSEAFRNCSRLTSINTGNGLASIGNLAFYSCRSLTDVNLSSKLTTIGDQTFQSCTALTAISLPASLTTINSNAFRDCSGLRQVSLPDNVTSIGSEAFRNCSSLTQVKLPSKLTRLEYASFCETGLTSVEIPEGLTSIGQYVFYADRVLSSVKLPSTLTSIEPYAFLGDWKLASIVIPEGVTDIQYSSFEECYALQVVSLPSTLTNISARAFFNCDALTSITIPTGVTAINENAFYSCEQLTSLYMMPVMPPSLPNGQPFGEGAFTRITVYTPTANRENYVANEVWTQFTQINAIDGVMAAQPTFLFKDYKLEISSLTPKSKIYYSRHNEDVVIDEAYLYTSPLIFTKNDTIRSIAVAEGFDNSIESSFIRNDMKVSDPTYDLNRSTLKLGLAVETPQVEGFPETRIYYKFYNGSNWNNDWQLYTDSIQMDRPGYVRCYVERDGWLNSEQREFNLRDNYYTATPSISALDNTTKTITISCGHGDAVIYYTLNGSDPIAGETDVCHLYNGESVTLDRNCEVRAMAVREGYFNSDVVSRSFSGLTNTFFVEPFNYRLIDNSTTNVVEVTTTTSGVTYEGDMTVPETIEYAGNTYTVTGIGYRAFYDKDNLTSISLPATITYIASQAFMNSDALTSVTLPDAVKTIDSEAFRNCSRLTNVNTGNGVTTICNLAFYNCRTLTDVTLSSQLITIGDQAFQSCTALTAIGLPVSLSTIGGNAFRDCSALRQIRLPDNVTSIGSEAFRGCSSLTQVKLPAKLTRLENYSFSGTGLTSIEIPEGVSSIGQYALYENRVLSSVKLPSTLTSIEQHAFWGDWKLASIVIPEGVTDIQYRTFEDCSALQAVSLPSTLTNISARAFYNCDALTNITIPTGVTAINENAFYSCEQLTSLYMMPVMPPSLPNGQPFGEGAFTRITVYTPTANRENYVANEVWTQFTQIRAMDGVMAAQPTFIFKNYQLEMATTTANAIIYYTRDGNDPTIESSRYTAPIPLTANDTIRAIAVAENCINSVVSEYIKNNYQVASPVATLNPDNLKFSVSVDIPTVEGLSFPETRIYWNYRSGRYDSAGDWQLYTDAVQMERPGFVRVRVERDGWIESSTVDHDFSTNYSTAQPTINIQSAEQTFTITHTLADAASIYYTMDGSDPVAEETTVSHRYSYGDSIPYIRNLQVKAIAVSPGHFTSDVRTQNITGVNSTFTREGIAYRLVDNSIENEVEVTTRPDGTQYADTLNIPDSVTYQGMRFAVTRIGNQAFYNNDNLKVVNLPRTLKTIGYRSFMYCDGIETIVLPQGVTTIEQEAFRQNSLKEFFASEGLQLIGVSAFYQCGQLVNVSLGDGLETIENNAFFQCNSLNNIVLPDGLQTIKYRAFRECRNLQIVALPETLKNIGYEAFCNDNSLAFINLPEGLEIIEYSTFYECSQLRQINIPSSLTSLSDYLFYNCGLVSIDVPATVKNIGNYTFRYCHSLERVTLHEGLETIGTAAFFNCDKLTTINIPEGISVLPNSCFDDCYALSSITLPSTLERIEERSLNTCSSLTTLVVPSKVNYVGPYGLTELNSLTKLFVEAVTPPSAHEYSFNDLYQRATLYVPNTDNYGDATYWANFTTVRTLGALPTEKPTFALEDYRLTISTLTEGDTIWFSRHGEPVVRDSLHLYNSVNGIPFTQNDTIRAIAQATGMAVSDTAFFARADFKVPAPTQMLTDSMVVYLYVDTPVEVENFPETRVYYNFVGRRNSLDEIIAAGDSLYRDSLQLTQATRLYAVAVRDGWIMSDWSEWDLSSGYTLNQPQISQEGNVITINANNDGEGVRVHYTLDGSDPTRLSAVYTGPFEIPRNLIVRAIVSQPGHYNSAISLYEAVNIDTRFMADGITYRLLDNTLENEVEVVAPMNEGSTYQGNIILTDSITYAGERYAVKGIASSAFAGQSNLTRITIPTMVTSIGASAFDGCSNLSQQLIIEPNIISVGNYAFRNTGITSLTVSRNQQEETAEVSVQRLEDWQSTNGGRAGSTSSNTYTFNGTYISFQWAVGSEGNCDWLRIDLDGQRIVESSGVNSGSFSRQINPGRHTLTVSYSKDGSVDANGDYGRIFAISMTGSSSFSIGEGAFDGCGQLQEVNFLRKTMSTGSNLFQNCSKLERVTINTETVGNWFAGRTSLHEVTLGQNVSEFTGQTFRGCTQLGNISLPTAIRSIPDLAFYECSNLVSVAMPDSLKSIGNQAFQSCRSLRSIVIPAKVAQVGNNAFRDVPLLAVTSLNPVPPTLGSDPFSTYAGTLFVPANSISTYQAAEPYWNQFGERTVAFQGYAVAQPSVVYTGHPNYRLTIESLTPNAQIHVANHGEEVTANSPVCGSSYQITRNDTLQFIATATGLQPSLPTTFTIDTLTVWQPRIELSDSMTFTLTSDAPQIEGLPATRIYYNFSGTRNSIDEILQNRDSLYQEGQPVQLTQPTNVYYVAVRDGWRWSGYQSAEFNNSNYTLNAPEITRNENVVTINANNGDDNQNIEVYYTLDGSEPSKSNGTRYTEPFQISRNLLVKAVAVQPRHFYSSIAQHQATGIYSTFVQNGIYYSLVDNTLENEVEVMANPNQYQGTISIPDSVTHDGERFAVVGIREQAFYDNDGVSAVSFPQTLRYVGNQAFYSCDNIETCQLPEGLLTIGNDAFAGCFSNEVRIPSTVLSIGSGAFYRSKMSKLTIPRGAAEDTEDEATETQKIYENWTSTNHDGNSQSQYQWTIMTEANEALLFSWSVSSENGCDWLRIYLDDECIVEVSGEQSNTFSRTFTVPGTHTLLARYSKDGSVNSGRDQASLTNIVGGRSISFLQVGDYAFRDCYNLREVDLHCKNVTMSTSAFSESNVISAVTLNASTIQPWFSGKGSLQEVSLGSNVTAISSTAFESCGSLQNISIPDNVTFIGEGAFRYSGVRKVTLPSTLRRLENETFRGCTALTSITLPQTMTEMGGLAFYDCQSLTGIVLPDAMTVIPQEAFRNCVALTSVALPLLLDSIAPTAFYNCQALPIIVLPGVTRYIGSEAFAGCSGLRGIYALRDVPADMTGGTGFTGITGTAALYVPESEDSLVFNAYQSAQYWMDFANIHTFRQLPAEQPTISWNNYVLTMSTPTPGAQIRFTNDGSDPTAQSQLYQGELSFAQNDTIRAIAIAEGYDPSLISEFRKNDLRVATPTSSLDKDLVFTITTETPQVTGMPTTRFYWQQNNSSWETSSDQWKLYTPPMQLTRPGWVHIRAEREQWIGSEYAHQNYNIDSLRFEQPSIDCNEETHVVTLAHTDPEAVILYTLDGTEPTRNSTRYTTPFTLTHNVQIRAIAYKQGHFNSELSAQDFYGFRVAQPQIAVNRNMVTVTVSEPTEGVSIWYSPYDPRWYPTEFNETRTRYSGPFEMADGQSLHFLATANNWTDSEQTELTYYRNNYTCQMPYLSQERYDEYYSGYCRDSLWISNITDGATVYYTLDGSTPTTASSRYTGSAIVLKENCMVKALTIKNGLFDSEIVTYNVTNFTVSQPQIVVNAVTCTISVEEPAQGTTIYYTTDGNAPTTESLRYTGPFQLNGDCYIYAIAVADNWNQSAVGWYEFYAYDHTCRAPQFSRYNAYGEETVDSLFITSETEGVQIYYTLDGSVPNEGSLLYVNGVKLEGNVTVRAIAMRDDMITSSVSDRIVQWFSVQQPVITFNGRFCNITTITEGATIFYTTDGTDPTTSSTLYDGPFAMPAQVLTVKALAYKANWNPATNENGYNPSGRTSEKPVIARISSTNQVQIQTTQDGGETYYTLNGLDPTQNDMKYTEPIIVEHNLTVKARTFHSTLYTSETEAFDVEWFKVPTPRITADGKTVTISCSMEGVQIYYTTDGSTPTDGSTLYTKPLEMSENTTIKAIAYYEEYNASNVTTHSYNTTAHRGATPTFTRDGNTITISTTTADATIYYTLDGSDPTEVSTRYTEPVTLTENGTLKAVAVHSNFFNSAVGSLSVTWFTTETPVIAFSGIYATITCATPNSRIYYTIDGTSPNEESLRYSRELTMKESCILKAIAFRDNFNKSSVASSSFDKTDNTVATPEFTRNGNTVAISTKSAENTTIYYTMDGTEPTETSSVYTAPIEMTENCTLKAMATNPKLFQSETAVNVVNWFKVEAPVMTLVGNTLTITSTTADATIYYEFDEAPTTRSAVYNGAITLTDNRMVFAMGVKKNFNNSEVSTVTPDVFICTQPIFNYNGRYLQIQTSEGMTIHYTTNGTKPTEESAVCNGQIEINELCTVRAIATRRDFRDSPEGTFKVDYLYDGKEASLDEPGKLEAVFQWIGGTGSVETLPVKGKMNAKDISFIRNIPTLKHLDLSEATYEGDQLPDEAFANLPLVSFSSPKQLSAAGSHLFKGCDKLAAVVWNANIAVPEDLVEDVNNPNFLLYVNSRNYKPSSYKGNLISGGEATSITLSDTETGGNFYAPERFYTQRISYTHNYSQTTESGVTRGWETLALPFDVETITHENRGALAPFAKGEDITKYKPFWLYELKETGFDRAPEIKAYIPYILSMPNNGDYADDYILAGNVTFTASNTYVEPDTAKVTMKGSVTFTPTMLRQEKADDVYAINLTDFTDDDGTFYQSGSAFVSDMREVRPFEAYALVQSGARSFDVGGYLWGILSDIRTAELNQLEAIGLKRGIYDLNGRRLYNDSSTLKKNKHQQQKVYIINGKKTLVK